MAYRVRINKRVRYVRVYSVLKRVADERDFLTRIMARIFAHKPAGGLGNPAQHEKWI